MAPNHGQRYRGCPDCTVPAVRSQPFHFSTMTIHPRSRFFSSLAVVFTASMCISHPAHAVKIMDLRAEQLMIGADSLRTELNLTPNQLTLWQQTVSRAQALLRTRQLGRDRLQASMKAALSTGGRDLRELNCLVDAEEAASMTEDRQLREHWLSVNDALTDSQRSLVIGLLLSQVERIDADAARGPAGGGGREGGKGPGGGRGQRPGTGGGPGMGSSAGVARCGE